MYVKTLSYRNFKGHSAAFELAPVTCIAGANFAHKTSIPLAIRLGLAGYLPPPIGTRGIFELAGNSQGVGEMEVILLMDTGRKVKWLWRKDEKGKVTTEGGLSADIAMPELMLDPRQFFAKTAAEQVQAIFDVCQVGPNEFGPTTIARRFGEVQVLPPAICEKTLLEIRQKMEGHSEGNGSIQSWIGWLIEYLKVGAKQAGDESKAASGAIKAFRMTEPDGAPANSFSMPKDVSADLEAAKADLDELKVKGGADNARLIAKRDALVAQLKQCCSRSEAITTAARIAKLAEQRALMGMGFEEDDEADELLEELCIKQADKTTTAVVASANVEELRKRQAQIRASEVCPTCGNKKKGWQGEASRKLDAAITEALAERDMAGKAVTEISEKISAVRKWVQISEQIAEMKRALANREILEDHIKEIEEQITDTNPEEIAKGIALEARIRELEQQQQAYAVYQQDHGRKQAIYDTIQAQNCRQEVFKAVLRIATEEQAKLINKAFGKVLNVARYFTDGLLNSPLEFVDGKLGRRVSQADRLMGCAAPMGSWIGFDTFSGTEDLLALAGFGVALTNDAPVKLVILDEMGRLDVKRKFATAERMLKLTEDAIIDQAILIDVSSTSFQPLIKNPQFKLLNL